jgi:hypothetical protein
MVFFMVSDTVRANSKNGQKIKKYRQRVFIPSTAFLVGGLFCFGFGIVPAVITFHCF